MSIQRTTQANPYDGLKLQENRPALNSDSTDVNPLATSNISGPSAEAQLAEQQQAPMLNQTLELIEEQENAIQAEYVNALHLAQITISNLQIAQQALLQQNALQTAQIIALQSQNNQSERIHKTDMKAAGERIDLLIRENDRLKATATIYEEAFSILETVTKNPRERSKSVDYQLHNSVIFLKNDLRKIHVPGWIAIDNQLQEIKQQFLTLTMEK